MPVEVFNATCYQLMLAIPQHAAPGTYQLQLKNGLPELASQGWLVPPSAPDLDTVVRIVAAPVWPATVFPVDK